MEKKSQGGSRFQSEDLTLVLVDDLTDEAHLSHLATDLEPALLGENGAEVPEEALHALLTLFRQTPGAEYRQRHPALGLHLRDEHRGRLRD